MGKTNKEDALAVSWRCCPQVLGLAKAANQGHAEAAKRGELSWRGNRGRTGVRDYTVFWPFYLVRLLLPPPSQCERYTVSRWSM
jgi:hypothetical protein